MDNTDTVEKKITDIRVIDEDSANCEIEKFLFKIHKDVEALAKATNIPLEFFMCILDTSGGDIDPFNSINTASITPKATAVVLRHAVKVLESVEDE